SASRPWSLGSAINCLDLLKKVAPGSARLCCGTRSNRQGLSGPPRQLGPRHRGLLSRYQHSSRLHDFPKCRFVLAWVLFLITPSVAQNARIASPQSSEGRGYADQEGPVRPTHVISRPPK